MTKLYEAKNHILIRAGYADPVEHRHMAAHLIVSLNGQMRVTSDKTEYLCRGIMIPPGASHAIDTCGNDVLVFLYDCTTDVAKRIGSTRCMTEECCEKAAGLYAAFERTGTTAAYCGLEQSLLAQLALRESACRVRDERILTAMRYIRETIPEKISCREVSAAVHLSQGRFSHLFKEQVGMTFAAYLIYQRIMRVYAEILRGMSVTEAALEAGFSSSAHFADVNRRVFGVPASRITRDLMFTKIAVQ